MSSLDEEDKRIQEARFVVEFTLMMRTLVNLRIIDREDYQRLSRELRKHITLDDIMKACM